MSAASYLENLLYQFLSKTLSDEEKRHLTNGWEAQKYIDEETEAEMKDAVFYQVKHAVSWTRIIQKLNEEAEEEDGESCCGSEED